MLFIKLWIERERERELSDKKIRVSAPDKLMKIYLNDMTAGLL